MIPETTLSAAIVTPPQPNHGSLGQIDQNTGNVTFTPAAGFSGNDSFTFKVIDSHQAESNVGTVSITVTPPVPLHATTNTNTNTNIRKSSTRSTESAGYDRG